jgi:hypothetical protein
MGWDLNSMLAGIGHMQKTGELFYKFKYNWIYCFYITQILLYNEGCIPFKSV